MTSPPRWIVRYTDVNDADRINARVFERRAKALRDAVGLAKRIVHDEREAIEWDAAQLEEFDAFLNEQDLETAFAWWEEIARAFDFNEGVTVERAGADDVEADEAPSPFGDVFVAMPDETFLCEQCARARGIDLGDQEVQTWEVGGDGWLAPVVCGECLLSIPVVLDRASASPYIGAAMAAPQPASEHDDAATHCFCSLCRNRRSWAAQGRCYDALVLGHCDGCVICERNAATTEVES